LGGLGITKHLMTSPSASPRGNVEVLGKQNPWGQSLSAYCSTENKIALFIITIYKIDKKYVFNKQVMVYYIYPWA
jgi:hypothetical protein